MIPSPREILWNQGCCCCCCCLNNSKKRPNFFNGKNGTFEVIETENLHRLWPWLQPRVKPKESEGCLKTDLEKRQEYTKFIFICIYQTDCRENQLAVSHLLFGFSNLNDVPQVDA